MRIQRTKKETPMTASRFESCLLAAILVLVWHAAAAAGAHASGASIAKAR
jgi:hypothetical protein